MQISKTALINLAAFIWFCGGVVLIIKGCVMLRAAFALDSLMLWISVTFVGGIIVGLIKARFIFIHALKKNLKRIKALSYPAYPWQCYRIGFFIFLAVVITLSKFMTSWSEGHFVYILLIAALDLSIATALLSTGFLFWYKQDE
jgi:hypothetical protein